jgi:hypothetical protein
MLPNFAAGNEGKAAYSTISGGVLQFEHVRAKGCLLISQIGVYITQIGIDR